MTNVRKLKNELKTHALSQTLFESYDYKFARGLHNHSNDGETQMNIVAPTYCNILAIINDYHGNPFEMCSFDF